MLFRIEHRTSYRFSRPVFLEPHILHLRPRCDFFQSLHEFSLEITPPPAGRSDGYDAQGNHATVLWFDGLTPGFDIRSRAVVETLRPNPFDYLLTEPATATLPVAYPPWEEGVLQPFRKGGTSPRVGELAAELAEKAGRDTVAFLAELTTRLYRDWKVMIREEGDPMDPDETLEKGEASCRDLTVLFMAVCRAVGIASRFVSGYQEGDPGQKERYMHAWPEIYLPGAGWRGYDPTHGLAVSDRHVALASGAEAILAAPTAGTFRGTGVSSTMEVDLSIVTSP